MPTRIIDEGKPTKKTLGELVGHVVTVLHEQYLVCRLNPIAGKFIYLISLDISTRHVNVTGAEDSMKADLDHGPLKIATEDRVCAPRVEAVRGDGIVGDDYWEIRCTLDGTRVHQFYGDAYTNSETRAKWAETAINKALSHLPRESGRLKCSRTSLAAWVSVSSFPSRPPCAL